MAADPITSNTVGELLSYDLSDEDDPFGDNTVSKGRDDKTTLSPRAPKRKADDDNKENLGLGLGLDEEVKITKKRKPIAKLDEVRLMSKPGLPKLHALARSGQFAKKLHLKGKGYEFTDAARLLTYYQLWLDDLYPRAKFADALQLVEKAGHSKSLQRQRREWIDEGKPGYIRERERRKEEAAASRSASEDAMMSGGLGISDDQNQNDTDNNTSSHGSDDITHPRSIFGNRDTSGNKDDLFFTETGASRTQDDAPDDDELEALLAEQNEATGSLKAPDPESEGEDDLDALLAEENTRRKHEDRSKAAPTNGMFEEDEDDLDALLAEHEAGQSNKGVSTLTQPGSPRNQQTPESTLQAPAEMASHQDEGDELQAQHLDSDDEEEEAGLRTPAVADKTEDSQGRESNFTLLSSPIPNDELDNDNLHILPAAQEQVVTLSDITPKSTQELPTNPLQSDEPDLPDLPQDSGSKNDSQGKESGILFSSSPIPNDVLELDDLDALMDEQDKTREMR